MAFIHETDADLDIVRGPLLDIGVRRVGAELVGLTWKHPAMGRIELLWRSWRLDSPGDGFWPRHAPILFPAVGGLHNNRSRTTAGDEIRFPGLHGFARGLPFRLVGASGSDEAFLLVYRLDSSDETRRMYPWDFTLTVTYTLRPDRLEITTGVTNRDHRPMPYQLGWHPGFNAPVVSGEKAGCTLKLPAGMLVLMENDDDCKLTGRSRVVEGGPFDFTEEGLERTYMLDLSPVEPWRRCVDLLDPGAGAGVRVGLPDYPHLGLWSDAGAPFVCIEPWQGMDDSVVQEPFDRKFGVVVLEAGGRDFRTAWVEPVTG